MLKSQMTPLGIESPSDLFRTFHEAGSSTLLALRNYVTSPDTRKKPRTWGAIEAANMVKISSPTFRKLQKAHEVPGVFEEITPSGRKVNKYSLLAINKLRDLAGTRYKRPIGSKTIITPVTNLKGGVAKTETAVDLGKKAAIEGLRVLLLDFDAQATSTLLTSGLLPDLELQYDDTITPTLVNNPELIKEIVLHTNFDGLDIIPANLAIQDCDLILPNEKQNNHAELGSPFMRLSNALDLIKDNYDVILFDCGPNVGILTLNAIISCNGLIIPVPPSGNDYASFITYSAILENIFSELPEKKLEYLRIIITRHKGDNEALQMENLMREQFGGYILTNHMCETVEVPKAATEVGTVYDIAKPRGSREAYRRATQHLDDVNNEIIGHFKQIWEQQSQGEINYG